MAPNASALSMECPQSAVYMYRELEPSYRGCGRSNIYGRTSVSPSLLYSRSSPQPSFRNVSFIAIEKSQSYHCGPSSRNCTQFRVQNSHPSSDKYQMNHSISQINRFTPKRRTQSESVSGMPTGHRRQEFRSENIQFPPKSCNSESKTAISKSKSVPSKLPFTAVTCAELEATVGKTRPKLFTCAELEALQAEDNKAVLKANDKEKKGTESPLSLPAEERKPELSVILSADDTKPESPVILPVEEMTRKLVEALEDNTTEICSWDFLKQMVLQHQISVSRSQSVSSEISTQEELSSRSNSPFNSCSSPVSSVSSGYDSCSSESCDSSPKFTAFDNSSCDSSPKLTAFDDSSCDSSPKLTAFDYSGFDSSDVSNDTDFEENDTTRKSLLAEFIASDTKGSELRRSFDSLFLTNAAETETGASCLWSPLAINGSQTKFVGDTNQADQSFKKLSSNKSLKKKPLLSEPSPVYPEKKCSRRTYFRVINNTAASGSSGKKSRKVVSAALPPSPLTTMPLTSSPPGALQLPSPPQEWKSGDGEQHGALPRSLDITREIKMLVGVAHIAAPCRVAPGTPITVC